uniref:Uncharacterized protein n=1 Tax=Chromera velia CCMP2878 TaxID=1169474 RepID=A0A0G4IEL7_9ALVE|eukprot:Cvel_13737.t1-p1 / transcript=Cvel_13737.t1 / gene=Cvel_13737 / organism=Chromera_velia_CCMP2878 / gene_product=hypothetical protein / transcript_product=hypothetical protein / location=Cvel_scaffold950:42295-45676(+) / protein_length=970 / sequence_SO=supercontig / SO=protein_coding / is_pseudo=false
MRQMVNSTPGETGASCSSSSPIPQRRGRKGTDSTRCSSRKGSLQSLQGEVTGKQVVKPSPCKGLRGKQQKFEKSSSSSRISLASGTSSCALVGDDLPSRFAIEMARKQQMEIFGAAGAAEGEGSPSLSTQVPLSGCGSASTMSLDALSTVGGGTGSSISGDIPDMRAVAAAACESVSPFPSPASGSLRFSLDDETREWIDLLKGCFLSRSELALLLDALPTAVWARRAASGDQMTGLKNSLTRSCEKSMRKHGLKIARNSLLKRLSALSKGDDSPSSSSDFDLTVGDLGRGEGSDARIAAETALVSLSSKWLEVLARVAAVRIRIPQQRGLMESADETASGYRIAFAGGSSIQHKVYEIDVPEGEIKADPLEVAETATPGRSSASRAFCPLPSPHRGRESRTVRTSLKLLCASRVGRVNVTAEAVSSQEPEQAEFASVLTPFRAQRENQAVIIQDLNHRGKAMRLLRRCAATIRDLRRIVPALSGSGRGEFCEVPFGGPGSQLSEGFHAKFAVSRSLGLLRAGLAEAEALAKSQTFLQFPGGGGRHQSMCSLLQQHHASPGTPNPLRVPPHPMHVPRHTPAAAISPMSASSPASEIQRSFPQPPLPPSSAAPYTLIPFDPRLAQTTDGSSAQQMEEEAADMHQQQEAEESHADQYQQHQEGHWEHDQQYAQHEQQQQHEWEGQQYPHHHQEQGQQEYQGQAEHSWVQVPQGQQQQQQQPEYHYSHEQHHTQEDSVYHQQSAHFQQQEQQQQYGENGDGSWAHAGDSAAAALYSFDAAAADAAAQQHHHQQPDHRMQAHDAASQEEAGGMCGGASVSPQSGEMEDGYGIPTPTPTEETDAPPLPIQVLPPADEIPSAGDCSPSHADWAAAVCAASPAPEAAPSHGMNYGGASYLLSPLPTGPDPWAPAGGHGMSPFVYSSPTDNRLMHAEHQFGLQHGGMNGNPPCVPPEMKLGQTENGGEEDEDVDLMQL